VLQKNLSITRNKTFYATCIFLKKHEAKNKYFSNYVFNPSTILIDYPEKYTEKTLNPMNCFEGCL